MDNKFTQVFNRHIAKVMGLLDLSKADEQLKKEIKREIWFIHDDLLKDFDIEYNGNTDPTIYNVFKGIK